MIGAEGAGSEASTPITVWACSERRHVCEAFLPSIVPLSTYPIVLISSQEEWKYRFDIISSVRSLSVTTAVS
jgi:hypothetical protein